MSALLCCSCELLYFIYMKELHYWTNLIICFYEGNIFQLSKRYLLSSAYSSPAVFNEFSSKHSEMLNKIDFSMLFIYIIVHLYYFYSFSILQIFFNLMLFKNFDRIYFMIYSALRISDWFISFILSTAENTQNCISEFFLKLHK